MQRQSEVANRKSALDKLDNQFQLKLSEFLCPVSVGGSSSNTRVAALAKMSHFEEKWTHTVYLKFSEALLQRHVMAGSLGAVDYKALSASWHDTGKKKGADPFGEGGKVRAYFQNLRTKHNLNIPQEFDSHLTILELAVSKFEVEKCPVGWCSKGKCWETFRGSCVQYLQRIRWKIFECVFFG